jgi:hypothetical protein
VDEVGIPPLPSREMSTSFRRVAACMHGTNDFIK